MARCDRCGDEIRWVVTENGKSIPLDVTPTQTGRYVVPTGDQARRANDLDRKLLRPAFDCHWDRCKRS